MSKDGVANGTFWQMIAIENATCRAFAVEREKIRGTSACCDPGLSSPSWCWRERVVQWYYDVIDHLEENRELTYYAMNILDRFSGDSPIDDHSYEVEAMAALFLAVRVRGSGRLSLEHLIEMSGGRIREKDVVAKGKAMISTLTWDQPIVTPADFVRALIFPMCPNLFDGSHQKAALLESSLYMVELSVFDQILARKRPSLIAAAATVSAISRINVKPENKGRLLQMVNLDTRFGDLTMFQLRLDMLFNEVPGNQAVHRPHLILDDEVPYTQSNNLVPLVSNPDRVVLPFEN